MQCYSWPVVRCLPVMLCCTKGIVPHRSIAHGSLHVTEAHQGTGAAAQLLLVYDRQNGDYRFQPAVWLS
jgi:hypothetical protein